MNQGKGTSKRNPVRRAHGSAGAQTAPGFEEGLRTRYARRRMPDPALRALMERMRAEVAQELGLTGVAEADFSRATTAQCGKFGQVLYARAKSLLLACSDDRNRAAREDGVAGADGDAGSSIR